MVEIKMTYNYNTLNLDIKVLGEHKLDKLRPYALKHC